MNTRTLAYKFALTPSKRQAKELDRWCNASRYAWNWALAEYESALDEVRASDPDADGKRATGSVRDVLERRMHERGIETKSRGKNKADPTRTKSLDTVLGALLNHHRKTDAPPWACKDVHSQVWSYTNTDLCAAIKRWWAAKGKRTPWITASERRNGKKRRKGPGAKGSQGRLVGPPRYKRRDANPSWRFQAPKPRSGKLIKEEYLREEDGEPDTRMVRVGATCARDTLVDRHAIRLPMHLGRVRVDDATGTRNGIKDAESPIKRLPKDAVPKVVTIRKIARTRWEASIVVQEPWEVPEVLGDLPKCGIDLGINAEATIAWGDGRVEQVEPPRPMQFLGIGLIMLQRKLSRSQHVLRCMSCKHESLLGKRNKRIRVCKQVVSQDGAEKECGGRIRRWRSWRGMQLVKKIAIKHDKIARVRADHLHRLSHRLIRESSAICTEPHNITGLVSAGVAKRCERLYRKGLRRRDIRRSMLDIGWGELRRQLNYKAPWKGKEYTTMPKGSVTNQACWRCGMENKVPDHTSDYLCDNCHWHGTRQENTALLCLAYIDPKIVPPQHLWDEEAAE